MVSTQIETWVYKDLSSSDTHQVSISYHLVSQLRYQLGRFLNTFCYCVLIPCIHLYTGPTLVHRYRSRIFQDTIKVHIVFLLIVYTIGGLHCRLQIFNWMENSVHLGDFQQSEIHFIPFLPGRFQI